MITSGGSPFAFGPFAAPPTTDITILAGNGNNAGACNGSTDTRVLRRDFTVPVVTPTATPAANAAGWNKANVNITWSATDTGGSGVAAGPTPGTDSVTTDGIVTKTSTATDNVGNVGNGSLQVKLDKTAPTITGGRTPVANSNGWNNSDVTVSFTSSDATSGIKSSSGPTVLSTTQTAAQSVTGTAVDNADNSASATVNNIKIDKVAPSLTGAPTTSPNGAGWYKNDVTVHWSATDANSGLGPVPADSTISGEGNAQTASASVSDLAGNSTNATSSPAVKIDKTAPATTVTAPPAWNKTSLNLTLVPSDGLSGLASTSYILDGGATQGGTAVAVSAEGNHTLQYWSTDKAGNVESTHSVTFGIDRTSPTIGHTQSPAGNADGWNSTDVVVHFICADALSGVASCTSDQTTTTEGSAVAVTGTVVDNAGNSATDPVSLKIDKTKPTINVTLDRPANADHWYNANVTATYTCADSLSGIKSCSPAHVFAEGASQQDTGTATDAAGNSDSATVTGVNVDKTNPTITGAVTTAPNGNGWYQGDVIVHWTCSDALSGVVSCPANSVISGEGNALSASASVFDHAGNTSSATVSGIQIDRHAPNTTASAVPAGFSKTAVTVAFTAVDTLSGVDATFYTVDGGAAVSGGSVTVGTEGTHTVQYYSVDKAGNVETAKSVTVRIDLSPPTISASVAPVPNSAGWNNSLATVTFTCSDQATLSGVAVCPPQQTVSAETAGLLVSGAAFDNAGNTASTSVTVKLDLTAPTIAGSTDRAPNAAGWYKANVTVTFTGSDPLSGLKFLSPASLLVEGENQSVTGTATDAADNTSHATVDNIDIDKTAPLLSVAPTTLPNSNGWYNTDVSQHWSASDALSGLSAPAPADSLLSDEGIGLTATQAVTDSADNTTTTTSAPVKIDKTGPSTDISAPSGWVNSSVHVTFSPHDSLSGVEETHFAVDGGPSQTGTSLNLVSEGTHTITYSSTDRAGNVEATNTATVLIDKSNPTITHLQAPVKNAYGWNNTNVTVTFTCLDQPTLSGIASCISPQTVTTEGLDQPVVGTAVDNAGNSATDPTSVSIDKTAPGITALRTPDANTYGWNKSDVTVHYVATDALSGVKATSDDDIVGEGTDQSRTGTATDAAGNSASATVSGINVDETAPSLSGTPTTAANSKGWYKGDVTIAWACGDDRSGVLTCPADSSITGEGVGLTSTRTVDDRAGNSTTKASTAVKIDTTAPSTTSDAPVPWQKTGVSVTLSPNDNLSGVDATYYTVDSGTQQSGTTILLGEGVHTLMFWSVDNAGDIEAANTVTVRIDLTDPTITHTLNPLANANGWNRTPVTVKFTCADTLSGVGTCNPDIHVPGDGTNISAPGTAVDNAGNSAVDNALVSIDSVKPTILGSTDRPANANGWYRDDVTASFVCTDDRSGIVSGTNGCSGPTTLGEGEDQSVTGHAKDAADNTQTTTVDNIDIDKTAPTLSGATTSSPNGAGWYNGDVTIQWTATDDLSHIDGAQPADSVIAGEGDSLTATATTQDRAGNETSSTSAPVQIDRHAPTTGISDVSDWSNTGVTVTLTASDNLSGVAVTHYQVDGGTVHDGTTLTIDAEGIHQVDAWSVDVAGNVEAHKQTTVKIDKTAPGISHSQNPVPNAQGWNQTDVTVSFLCTDTAVPGVVPSGIAACTAPVTLTGEGAHQPVAGHAADNAGNTADDGASVSIDKTKPTLTAALDRSANAAGWFNAPVTATFTCADQAGLSGVPLCAPEREFVEGADQTATGTATDGAGNVSDPATIAHINVDLTNPLISGAVVGSPNVHGWFRDDVTVDWTCTDALSGVAVCPGSSTVDGEGDNLATSATAMDQAGNEATAEVKHIHIDRTSPTTSTTGVPSGWVNTATTVVLHANDALSGVGGTFYNVDGEPTDESGMSVTLSTEGVHVVSYWSVDNAGNAEVAKSFTVTVDLTKPIITASQAPAKNGGGWNNSDVTVTFDCADALSGVASCPAPKTVSVETFGTIVGGTAIDNAGNTESTSLTLKLDKTAPTITGSTDRAPNAAHWYNDDVTVAFVGSDDRSGVKSLTGSVTLGEGENQHVDGTVVDAADNSASTTVSDIDVDKTAPVLTVAPTTPANAAGWYKTDVTQHWTASDALSGLAVDVPADTLLSTEGDAVTATASVTDKAGNNTTKTSAAVKIDKTAPTTDVSAPSSWVNQDVTVTFTAHDGGSGVAATHYNVDGGPDTTGVTVDLAAQGTHLITYASTDVAGNIEAAQQVTVLIDKTNPTIGHSQSPAKNANGWNNGSVTVTFTCGDQSDLSGVASCTTPALLDGEGQGQTVAGTAVDHAGNSASDHATVDIDLTAPGITGSRTPAANPNGWNNSDVTVHFDATDGLSGVDSVTPNHILGEGTDQSVPGTAYDNAGNSAGTTVSHVNVDETAPTLAGTPTTAANGYGWYRGDVSISWSCHDDRSGVAHCPSNTTVGGEGMGLTSTASTDDNAGNVTTVTAAGVKIDRTAPGTVATAPSGWSKTAVTVTFSATDNLSGVHATYYTVDGSASQSGATVTVSTEGTHTVGYWSVDKAGNVETAQTVQVLVDLTNPTLTSALTPAANGAGWRKTPVNVHFSCADQPTLSGVNTCPPDATVSAQGNNLGVSGLATDRAGNQATLNVTGIKVDTVAPVVTVSGVSDGATYVLGAVPTPSCAATDATSGVAGSCSGVVSGGLPNGVGTFSYTATATDVAGNTTTTIATYKVRYGYGDTLFLQPVNDTAHQKGVATSVFNGGQTIPMKFQIKNAAGAIIQAGGAPKWLTPVKGGAVTAAVNEGAYATSASSGSTYAWGGNQYQYNWNTDKAQAGFYWRVGVALDDGQTYYVNIGLK
jgi:hypothetical protein